MVYSSWHLMRQAALDRRKSGKGKGALNYYDDARTPQDESRLAARTNSAEGLTAGWFYSGGFVRQIDNSQKIKNGVRIPSTALRVLNRVERFSPAVGGGGFFFVQPSASYPRGARRACFLRSLPSRAQARQTLRPRPRLGGVSWRGLRAAVRSKGPRFAYNINR